ncbi:hypothetical protein BD560DRAFT_387428 [Blakeslea trispora]|nr:hypothetical protein BD560DRAFT_387428 [Blakeslea trispora]
MRDKRKKESRISKYLSFFFSFFRYYLLSLFFFLITEIGYMYCKAYSIAFWAFLLTYFLSHARNDSGHPAKEDCTTVGTVTTALATSTIIIKSTPTYIHGSDKGDCHCIQGGKKCECKLPPKYEPALVAAASLLIIFGSVFLLGGFKLFRVTITLAGFSIGCKLSF